MQGDDKDLVRVRAYLIWEREGRPEGRADAHWRMAEEELGSDEGQKTAEASAGLVAERPADVGPASGASLPDAAAVADAQQAEPAPRRRRAK